MASTHERMEDQPHSLLPEPIPASELGRLPVSPVRQPTRLPRPWHPTTLPRRMTVVVILFLLLLLGGGIGMLAWALHPQVATITVTPQQRIQTQTITTLAVPGHPAAGQIQARTLSATATRQTSTPVPTSGVKNVPELVASGNLTFYNGLTKMQTVNPDTVFTASTGIQIKSLAQAVIPPSSGSTMGYTTVPAQATQPGSIGNIPVHAINVNIGIGGSILVMNQTAFTGGQDAESYRFVQQSDVDHAAASLAPQALQSAKTALATQVGRNDLAVAQQCTTSTQSTPAVGDKAATVSVTVTAVCHEGTYTPSVAQSQALAHYRSAVETQLGSFYALSGHPALSSAQVETQGQSLAITYTIRGRWLYQLHLPELQHLVFQFLGKPWSAAQASLLKQPGVAAATITGTSGSALPANQGQLQIHIGN